MQHAHKTTELAPDERVAVERLIGRPLEQDEAIEVITHKTDPGQLEECKADQRPIWEVILDNMQDVPNEEFAKLPKDGASEHDHYLYGAPKRNQ
jgi:hypothetical protein